MPIELPADEYAQFQAFLFGMAVRHSMQDMPGQDWGAKLGQVLEAVASGDMSLWESPSDAFAKWPDNEIRDARVRIINKSIRDHKQLAAKFLEIVRRKPT